MLDKAIDTESSGCSLTEEQIKRIRTNMLKETNNKKTVSFKTTEESFFKNKRFLL